MVTEMRVEIDYGYWRLTSRVTGGLSGGDDALFLHWAMS